MSGIREMLAELAGDGRTWMELGTVTAIEVDPILGFLLTLELQPQGVELQARPAWLMGGAPGEGIYSPIAVGDEVLVLLPSGDLNRAIAWPGPPSGVSRPPLGWLNDRIALIHSGGLQIKLLEAAPAQLDISAAGVSVLSAAPVSITGATVALAGAAVTIAAAGGLAVTLSEAGVPKGLTNEDLLTALGAFASACSALGATLASAGAAAEPAAAAAGTALVAAANALSSALPACLSLALTAE